MFSTKDAVSGMSFVLYMTLVDTLHKYYLCIKIIQIFKEYKCKNGTSQWEQPTGECGKSYNAITLNNGSNSI